MLRIGWAQDPQTLNPFVGSGRGGLQRLGDQLGPARQLQPEGPDAGARASPRAGTISDDKKTDHLPPDPGREVVRRQADHLRGRQVLARGRSASNGALFTSYTDNVTTIDTPDAHTVVVHTKRPDARIIGGLFIYILPKHIWGKVPVKELTGSYKPELPLVGSGPYIVTEFEPGRILKMERNPNFRGPAPTFDQIQFIKYGNQDAVERALQLGEVDIVAEVQAGELRTASATSRTSRPSQASTPAYTELAFNLCSAEICPDAKFNPAVQDRAVRQAIAYAVDRERINAIAARGTSFPGHGILPSFYKSFYQAARPGLPVRPGQGATRSSTTRAGHGQRRGPRTKGGERAVVQPLRALGVAVQHPGGEADRRGGQGQIGVEFNVQVVSTDKLTDLTVRKVERQAGAGLRHVHLGLGRRPVRPELPAQPPHDRARSAAPPTPSTRTPSTTGSSTQQAGAVRHRRAQGDHPEDGRDHPARPALPRPHLRPEPAGLPDRHGRERRAACPAATTGDIICEQTRLRAAAHDDARGGRRRLETRAAASPPASRSSARDRLRDRRLASSASRSRRRREPEPLELEE